MLENEEMVDYEDEEFTEEVTDETEETGTGEEETELAEPSAEENSATENTESPEEAAANAAAERAAMQAQKRREREQKQAQIIAREREKAYQEGVMAAVGKTNPYTNEEIKDRADVEEYLLMREIEKSGGDPLTDYSRRLKQKQKEAQAAAQADRTAQADLLAFQEAYPDVNVGTLLQDKRFEKFAGKRLVNGESLASVYGDYKEFTADMDSVVERRAVAKAKNVAAKAKASPGSLRGGGETQAVSYADMSDEAFERELARAKRGELKKK